MMLLAKMWAVVQSGLVPLFTGGWVAAECSEAPGSYIVTRRRDFIWVFAVFFSTIKNVSEDRCPTKTRNKPPAGRHNKYFHILMHI